MPEALAEAYVRLRPSIDSTFKPESERLLSNSVDGTAAGQKIGTNIGKGARSKLSPAFKGAFAGALAGFTGPALVGKVVDGFKGIIAAGRESNRVTALTAQVIKTTGTAAGVSAGYVSKLSTAISNKTGVDDEAIQSGANLLLTFTNVQNHVGAGNKIFDQATQTITDMSAALGQDTKSSAIQLGKALNDPIKGVTALQRVGVSFTKQQKDQIQTLVKSGNTLGAQKLILGELSKEFGGAAAAASTPSQKLAVAADNIRENVGQKLIPVLDGLANILLKDVGPALSAIGGFISRNSSVILPLVAALGAAVAVIKIISLVTRAWTAAQLALDVALNANPISLIVIALAALVVGLIVAYKKSQTFRAIVQAAMNGVMAAFRAVWAVAKAVFNGISSAISATIGFIQAHWRLILGILTGPFGLLVVYVSTHFSQIINLVKSIPGRILKALGNLNNLLIHAGEDLILGFIHGITNKIGGVKDTLAGLTSKLTSWKGPPAKDRTILRPSGRMVIDGFIGGLQDRFGGVRASLGALTGSLSVGPTGGFTGAAGTSSRGSATAAVGGMRQPVQLVVDGRVLAEVMVSPLGHLISNRPLP